MNLRIIKIEDMNLLKEMHQKHYKEEFEFPNFSDKFLSSFVVTDENDKIITGGGVRTIAESVIITDKDYDITKRREALQEILMASAFAASANEYKQLHAFIQDAKWLRHLRKAGFKETVGKSIVLNL